MAALASVAAGFAGLPPGPLGTAVGLFDILAELVGAPTSTDLVVAPALRTLARIPARWRTHSRSSDPPPDPIPLTA